MEFLLDKIWTFFEAKYARSSGISDQLKAWDVKLRMIQNLMDSAEENQMKGDPAAVQWLADLRQVAYDMEDLLDDFSVEAKRNPPKKRTFSDMIWGHPKANEIEDVDRRLKEVLDQLPRLGLVQNLRSRSHDNQPRFTTTSLPEPKFVGREKQLEELLARLTRSDATHGSIRPFIVVSIVGMGGLGKTTLAQELYNHKSLENAYFAVKAWVCVSDVFDMAAITKSILEKVAPSSSGMEKDLNQLQNSLKEKLSGKKFLIVLDDVWMDEYVEIESLLNPLYSGSKGSMILLTTRNSEVARMAGDPAPKQLDFLSSEECLSLLAYHSIGEDSFEGHPHLRDTAVQLAKKCEGLPLSIKVIGGLLRFETDAENWRRLLDHGIWNLEGKISSALRLSYIYLPIRLKRCFTACSLFPKDYMFHQDEVIRLWNVQGLLREETGRTDREVGMKYLRRLEDVSLFQKARGKKNYYLMHDLVKDLAKSIDFISYFSSDENEEGSCHREASLDKVRHVAIVTKIFERCLSKKFDRYRSMRKLRTFMPFQISVHGESAAFVSQEVINDLIMSMKNLRMLSLRYFNIREVPDHIGELKKLRSVDFSDTNIEVLPESICNLVELQYLLLRQCTMLRKLPRNIRKLTNLLQLDITRTDSLEEMPPRIGDLTKLEILGKFVVGKQVEHGLKQLEPLKCLQRELHISNLREVDDVEDARIVNLSGKEGILELSLDWGSSFEIPREDDHQFNLLHLLQPPRKIESLVISRYGARRFPSWFDDHCCINNIMSITLTGCRSVDSLPSFGQLPLLERLDISGLEAVSSIGAEFYGSGRPYFQSLRRLSFTDMGAWEKWSSHGEDENERPFPRLHQLVVRNCPKLKGGCSTLSLPSLVEIDIDGCGEGLLKCLAGLASMTKMEICGIPELVHFEGSLSTSWVALVEMRIGRCPRFKSFVGGDGREQVPPKLKILEISGCRDIEKLPDDLCGLTSLNDIVIRDCEKFCSFPSGGLPPSLRRLKLDRCPRLPQSKLISSRLSDFLEELDLWDLEGLVSITELTAVGSPLSRSLRRLSIWSCRSLTTFTNSLRHMSVISDLTLGDCPELEMDIFPDLPCNLLRFKLDRCPKVKSLPDDMHHLTSLKSLTIGDCEGITRLPPSGGGLPPNLEGIEIGGCRNLNKPIGEWGLRGLTALRHLTLRGGLPPNLEWLEIGGCSNLNQPIGEWGLRGLTALRVLEIKGGMGCVDEMECFPPDDDDDADWSRLLPSSLLRLTIGKMKKLERVGRGLRHHLTSLRSLYIFNCERMRCLPEDGLPESLENLHIWGCPLLMLRLDVTEWEYWPHFRLIPNKIIYIVI